MKDAIKISKFLSLVLRHNPKLVGLVPDTNGWVVVDELLEKIKVQNINLTFEDLFEIVESNNKKRFAFSPDFKKIRANQGHSIEVDLEYQPQTPPDFLYHGTSGNYIDSILEKGLDRMNRHHVHLSQDLLTARNVGKRHGGILFVLKISAHEMAKDGFVFYLSENGVWLTDIVPKQFIEIQSSDSN